MAIPTALTRELGAMADDGQFPGDPWEETPELAWPNNLRVYDKMRTQDGQTQALLGAITYPILATPWRVKGAQVRPEVLAFVEAELGLALDEEGRRRTRDRGVSWDEFLRHALLMLPLGFMPFVPVYEIGPPETPGIDLPLVGHLRKLAPRMPRTVSSIDVAPDGGLRAIHQTVVGPDKVARDVPIPVSRLAYFCWDREGADWTGRSILRASYKDWLLKDAKLRLSAIGGERQSMGIPVVHYPRDAGPGARARALAIARAARAGEDSGIALEEGWQFSVVGVSGGTLDLLEWVKHHGQEQSKSALAMFLDLGHDNGARALGDTFVRFFLKAQMRVIRHVEEVVTQHIVRELVRHNFGANEPYPAVVADPLTAESDPTAEALSALVTAGLITPDQGLRVEVRRRYGLPPADGGVEPGPGDVPQQDDPGLEPAGGVRPRVPVPPVVPAADTPTREDDGRPRLVAASEGPVLGRDRVGNELREGDEVGVLRGRTVDRGRVEALQDGELLVTLHGGDVVQAPSGRVMSVGHLLAGTTYESETERIRQARGTAEARRPHEFRPAQWTHPNGHPRCALCGISERAGGCPGSDRDGLVTTQPGARSVTRVPHPGAYRRDDPRRAGDAAYSAGDVADLVERAERAARMVAALASR